MKSFIKGLIIMAAAFTCLFVFKPHSVHAAYLYNEYQEQFNASPGKAWRITFNSPVNLYTAQNNICVYDSANNSIPVTISMDNNDSKVVIVKPIYQYELGKRYSLIIKSDCASSMSKHLNGDIRMFFNIKTKLDPSDYNDGGNTGNVGDLKGIIIVGTDRAYSVSYLLQHADLANDINGDPSKKVYYIPDASAVNTQKIQNMFGDNFSIYLSINDLHKKNTKTVTYISDGIVYTDAIGNNYEYVWDSNTSTYKLQTPAVNVSVKLPSSTGAVSLTVNSVDAIPSAGYYLIDGTNIKRAIGQGVTGYVTMSKKIKIYILSANQTEIGYGYISVDNAGENIHVPITLSDDDDIGSETGNSNNNGSAVMDSDGYTYYLNSSDNDTIYREDTSGQYNIQIGLDRAQYMNEQNGWLYYSNYSDGEKIYRMHLDGTRREKVCDDAASYVVVYGDWIYYSNQSQGGKLYKIGVSAGASTKDEIQPDPTTYTRDATGVHGLIVNNVSSSQTIAYDEVAYLNVSHGWIYYVNNSDDHKIYKIDTKGNIRTKVNDEWSACPQVVGNQIYYCSKIGEIMKIGTDGKSNPVDIGAQAGEADTDTDKSFHINVNGDWIYYSNKNDGKTLYKVRTDGSGEKYKLTTMPINYVITAGYRLFIVSNRKEYTLPINTTGADDPVPVTKGNPDNQVDSVDDITRVVGYEDVNQSIEWLEDKYLPEKAKVVMKDDQQWQLTVSWDTKNKTFKDGIYTYTGKILGYDKTVKCYLIIPSEMLNGTNNIQIYNNPGTDNDIIKISTRPGGTVANPSDLINDKLTESVIKPGDYIRVYGDEAKKNRLDNGGDKGIAVDRTSTATISGLNLDLNSDGQDTVYITIQRSGKYESNATKVLLMSAPTILTDQITNKSAEDNDNVYKGVTGRDFRLTAGWNEASWKDPSVAAEYNKANNPTSNPDKEYNYMYIVPSGASLDISDTKHAAPIPIKPNDNVAADPKIAITSGINYATDVKPDNLIEDDSLNAPLKAGDYSIYISRHYNEPDTNTFVTADPNGSRPVVTGDVVSLTPATETTTDEEAPEKPTITSPTRTINGDPKHIIINNKDKIVLSKPLSKDQEIWFVPIEYAGNIDALYAQHKGYPQTDTSCLSEYYSYLLHAGLINKVQKVSGADQQNNFDVSTLGLTDKDGQTYSIFIMNNVGATELVDQMIKPDFKAPEIELTTSSGSTTGVSTIYDSTTDASKSVGPDTIYVRYTDVYNDNTPVVHNGTVAKLYVLNGWVNNISGDQITNIANKPSESQIYDDGTGTKLFQIKVSALPVGTSYPITIVAVDAGGNASGFLHVTVTNVSGGIIINH